MTKQTARTQSLAHKAAWDQRARETAMGVTRNGAASDRPRDRWAVTVLWRGGLITNPQHGAALRYSALLERATGAPGASLERIDGGGGDIHARAYDFAVCGLLATNAGLFVKRHTRHEGRRDVFERAFRFPHLPVRALGCATAQRAAAHLAPSLDLLAVYFDNTDRDREAWNKKALAEQCKSNDGFY